jgi:hypothetical protein
MGKAQADWLCSSLGRYDEKSQTRGGHIGRCVWFSNCGQQPSRHKSATLGRPYSNTADREYSTKTIPWSSLNKLTEAVYFCGCSGNRITNHSSGPLLTLEMISFLAIISPPEATSNCSSELP